jgi:uncharacterized membrane protein YtjA (UPF0391 family)
MVDLNWVRATEFARLVHVFSTRSDRHRWAPDIEQGALHLSTIPPTGTAKAETAFPHKRYPRRENRKQEDVVGALLYWAVVFLIVAIVAAVFGFGAVAGTAMVAAKIIFWVAIVLFVIALIGGFFRRGI